MDANENDLNPTESYNASEAHSSESVKLQEKKSVYQTNPLGFWGIWLIIGALPATALNLVGPLGPIAILLGLLFGVLSLITKAKPVWPGVVSAICGSVIIIYFVTIIVLTFNTVASSR